MKQRSRHWLPPALAAAFSLCSVPAGAAIPLEQLIEARDLVCEFYRSDDWAAVESRLVLGARADMFMVIENITRDPSAGRVVTSLTNGWRNVTRYQGSTGVHFVEDRGESVVVTTLLACEDWKRRRGREFCVRYSASNAWHFDESVHVDPDGAFLRLPASSYRGACEPWDPN